MRTQKTVRQRFVLAKQAQKEMFGLDVRAAKLAGFIPREEDYPARLFRVSLKHKM
jgi:hypothetical protein